MQKIQFFIVLVVILAITGCGPAGLKTQFVEGIVTLDGQPLEGALVTYVPVQQTPENVSASGLTDEAGRYTLTAIGATISGATGRGAPEGDYVVTIVKRETIDTGPRRSSDGSVALTSDGEVEMATITRMVTPQLYSIPNTTTLRATVQRGNNDIPFNIESR